MKLACQAKGVTRHNYFAVICRKSQWVSSDATRFCEIGAACILQHGHQICTFGISDDAIGQDVVNVRCNLGV